MKKNDIIEIKAGKLLFQGVCLSDYDGKKVFLEKCIPEDYVRARIKKIKKDYLEAEAVEIIKPSEMRIEAKCKHFGICGGCKIQNMNYADQLKSKEEIVNDSIKRIGKINNLKINKIIGADEIYYYRNKMEYSFGDKRWLINETEYSEDEKNFALGLHIESRYDKVLQIEECLLQSSYSNEVRNFISDFLFKRKVSVFSLKNRNGLLKSLIIRESKNTNDKIINLITTKFEENIFLELAEEIKKIFPQTTSFTIGLSSDNISSSIVYETINIFGENILKEKILNKEFEIGINSFFQTNTHQAEKLFSYVKNIIDEKSSEGLLLDLYCGVGVIGILLADKFNEVFGIDIIDESIDYANRNLKLNKINNANYIKGDLNKGILQYLEKREIDTVIFDPPRAGLSEKTIKEIIHLTPRKIIYISCNPTTQARDLTYFQENYSITLSQPIDLFPHTYHIENIAVMEII